MVDPAAALQKSENRTPAFITDLNIRSGAEPPGGCPSSEMSWAMVGAMVSTQHNPVGLARVSTVVQDAQLQRDALTAAGCGRIFEEKVSTRSSARPGLAAALDYLRPDNGDVLAVWNSTGSGAASKTSSPSLMTCTGSGVRMLTGKLSCTYSPTGEGKFFFTMVAAFAELEDDILQPRIRA